MCRNSKSHVRKFGEMLARVHGSNDIRDSSDRSDSSDSEHSIVCLFVFIKGGQ